MRNTRDRIRINVSSLVVSLGWLLSAGASATAATQVTMEEALHIALENNPELQSIGREIEAAAARQAGASRLLQSNPDLTAAAGPRSQGGDNSVDWGVALAQRVEIGGQRGARMDAADANLRSAQSQVAARRSELAAQLRESFGSVLATRELARLADEAVKLASDAVDAASARQEAGDATRIEVNTARIELGRAGREAATAAQARDSALASWRLLLGQGDGSDIVPADQWNQTELCSQSREALLDLARSQRGDLAAARAELEQAQAERTLAEKEAIASPSIGVAYNREDDADIVQATLSVPLPIVDRNQVARGVTGAGLARARIAVDALQRGVTRQVDLALAQCRAARAVVNSYRDDVDPAARSNLGLANEGYRAGKLDFLQLLLIRREALDARRDAIESLERWNEADAQMVRVTGSVK